MPGFPSRRRRFIPSSTGTKLFHPRTGDDLDGWNIKEVEIIPYNFSEHADYLIRSSGAAAGGGWCVCGGVVVCVGGGGVFLLDLQRV